MSGEAVRVGIWGSCVSRDTVEVMPEVEPVPYVARQSAIVSLQPYTGPLHLEALGSAFQRRMMEGDAAANAAGRIVAAAPQAVLIDLVDERRGVWRFPDGSHLTNSVEAFRTGVDGWAPEAGARLIEFGTDEHFELWREGFAQVTGRLRELGVPLILLDIAWAEVFDGQEMPGGVRSYLGARGRRLRRGYREAVQSLARGGTMKHAVKRFASVGPTEAEALAASSRTANGEYRRYAAEAGERVTEVISRTVADVRMDSEHRWGVGPYHYREGDYASIAAELRGRGVVSSPRS
ncbi:DUF6270 domain-containing protein [Brevibacterium album]|uniref:DUF6270 domain-containing protein n=1 Tax=Brevibacterium album TaxID=417948 RepID=UPI00041FBA3C|nr:DUF6270 domain-containing protein [Brevibacterium album]